MTLDDKRKVIEVLLCAAEIGPLSDQQAVIAARERDPRFFAAHRLRLAVEDEHIDEYLDSSLDAPSYRNGCIEAAYRLIESSPTLRREWFAPCLSG